MRSLQGLGIAVVAIAMVAIAYVSLQPSTDTDPVVAPPVAAEAPRAKRPTVQATAALPAQALIAEKEVPEAPEATPAQESYEALNADFQTYMALSMQPEVDPEASRYEEAQAIQAALRAKASAMTDLESAYTDVINQGEPQWAIRALMKLSEVYDEMGAAVEEMQPPPYLEGDRLDDYLANLEERARMHYGRAQGVLDDAMRQAKRDLPEDHAARQELDQFMADRP